MTNLDSILKSRDITLPTKVCLVKAMVFPGVMYGCELDYKESWVPKNWWFWTVLLEKTLESPLDCKEIQPVHPKGNQSWIFIGRTDAEAQTSVLWPPDVKNWLTWKDPDAGKGWRQEKKGTTEGDDWMASLTQWTGVLSKLWELVMDREPWPTVVQGVTKSQNTTEWPTAWCFPHGIIWVDFQDLRQIHRVYSLSLHNFVLGPNNIHTNPAKPCLAPLFFLFSSPTT